MDNNENLDSLLSLLNDEFKNVPENESIKKTSIKPPIITHDVSIFDKIDNTEPNTIKEEIKKLFGDDIDSSDDEEARNHLNTYSSCGKEINTILKNSNSSTSYDNNLRELTWKSLPPVKNTTLSATYDPVFGLRISNPVISSTLLKERMMGKQTIAMKSIKTFLQLDMINKNDWVIAGVIVFKSDARVSQKGSKYSIWTLSDLKDDLKTVSIFLFKNAHNHLWKMTVGTVVAVLNPRVFERRNDSKDEACLSLDNADRVMILGESKDLGFCKSRKKNGDICNTFVNVRVCEYCIYHMKQEYQKFSRRSELQSATGGRGLTALRNKVLGKNEVFYAGKSYMAIPAKKNHQLIKKDEERLKALANKSNILKSNSPVSVKTNAAHIEVSNRQRTKDLERLRLLGVSTDPLKDKLQSSVTKQSRQNVNGILSQVSSNNIKLDNSTKSMQIDQHPFSSENNTQNSSLKREKVDLSNSTCPTVDQNEDKFSPICMESEQNAKNKSTNISCSNNTKSVSLKSENISRLTKIRSSYSDSSSSGLKNDYARPSNILKSNKTNLDSNNINKVNLNKEKLNKSTCPKIDQNRYESSPVILENKQNVKNISINLPCSSNAKHSNSETNYQKPTNLMNLNKTNGNIETIVSQKKKNVSSLNSQLTNSQISTNTSQLDTTKSTTFHKPSEIMKICKTNTLITKPTLLKSSSGSIDLLDSKSIVPNKVLFHRSRINALKYVAQNGPIIKTDPMNLKGAKSTKRRISEQIENPESKRIKKHEELTTKSERFKQLMEAKSINQHLIDESDSKAQNDYFNKLEVKERIEEKMANTFKVPCKAVQCLQCKYTAFSASEMCKIERHPLKVIDSVKRFFQCSNCSNRTVTLEIFPLISCTKCGNSKWKKASMLKEKIVQHGEQLSLRGDEEMFIGSNTSNANINLLVPE